MGRGPGRGKVYKSTSKGKVVWVGDWRDSSGRRCRKYLGATRAQAEHVLSKLIRDRDLELQGMARDRASSMTLAHIAEQYLASLATRARARTVAESRGTLERLIRDLGPKSPPSRLSVAVMMGYQEKRSRAGSANKTINNDIAPLKAALNQAVALGQLASHPFRGLKGLPTKGKHQRRRRRDLSEWEITRLIASAREVDVEEGGFPRAPLVIAFLYTGARYGELAKACWYDANLAEGALKFRAEHTKSGRARTVPLHSGLLAAIAELPRAHILVTGSAPRPASRIFLRPTGLPWPSFSAPFRSYLRRICKRAKIPLVDDLGRVVDVHSLRHTFVTWCKRRGIDTRFVQEIVGHASPEMTDGTYTHLDLDDVKKVVESLPSPIDGGKVATSEGDGPISTAAACSPDDKEAEVAPECELDAG